MTELADPHDLDDVDLLVRAARRTLAGADAATLLVDGVGHLGPQDGDIVLDEIGGRPRLLCAGDSAVAQAADARQRAILTVSRGGHALEVILAGYLAEAADAAAGIIATSTRIVELRLVSVVVELPPPGGEPDARVVRTRQLPLHRYLGSDVGVDSATDVSADGLQAAAETMLAHTNAHHADRLRALAAVRAGRQLGDILQAHLVRIDARGAALEWIDADGVHPLALDFPRPAIDPADLALLLRCRLTGGTCR